MVFSGSSQTMANESISIPDATDRLVEEGVTVIAVGMGPNADPAVLLAVVSDPDNVFFEDAVEALKSAVKDAAKTDDDGFPGQNHLKMPENKTNSLVKKNKREIAGLRFSHLSAARNMILKLKYRFGIAVHFQRRN